MAEPAGFFAANSIVGGAASGTGIRLTGGTASGDVIFLEDGLSFWGGVDLDSGTIIDTHHPACGQSVTGLSGCRVRLGGIAACVEAAVSGLADTALPGWLGH